MGRLLASTTAAMTRTLVLQAASGCSAGSCAGQVLTSPLGPGCCSTATAGPFCCSAEPAPS
jgi:hypothetical protein